MEITLSPKMKDLAVDFAFEIAYQTCETAEQEYYYWKMVKNEIFLRMDRGNSRHVEHLFK